MPDTPTDPTPRVIADVTCLACGCLCDDIELTVSSDRIVEARRACPRGLTWFTSPPLDAPESCIDGQPASREDAVHRAAAILRAARCAIVLGLSGTTIEAQRIAVAIADLLGATIDPAHAIDAAPGLAAFQRAGKAGASLGEVRNRADVLLFWCVDPVTTHPRHFERYSVDPPGRFVPQGRANRTLLVADYEPTATSERADLFLPLTHGREFETLRALRARVRGAPIPVDELSASCGVPAAILDSWADALVRARYGAFFHGPALGACGAATVQEAIALVRDRNEPARFVALALGGPGNPSGAEAVLTWQAGAPLAVDFARGVPRFLPSEAGAHARLVRGEADAALVVGPLPDRLPSAAIAHLESIPRVVIAPDATVPPVQATVALASARAGIEAGGTVLRCDGVTLPLRPALAMSRPADQDHLAALLDALTRSET